MARPNWDESQGLRGRCRRQLKALEDWEGPIPLALLEFLAQPQPMQGWLAAAAADDRAAVARQLQQLARREPGDRRTRRAWVSALGAVVVCTPAGLGPPLAQDRIVALPPASADAVQTGSLRASCVLAAWAALLERMATLASDGPLETAAVVHRLLSTCTLPDDFRSHKDLLPHRLVALRHYYQTHVTRGNAVETTTALYAASTSTSAVAPAGPTAHSDAEHPFAPAFAKSQPANEWLLRILPWLLRSTAQMPPILLGLEELFRSQPILARHVFPLAMMAALVAREPAAVRSAVMRLWACGVTGPASRRGEPGAGGVARGSSHSPQVLTQDGARRRARWHA